MSVSQHNLNKFTKRKATQAPHLIESLSSQSHLESVQMLSKQTCFELLCSLYWTVAKVEFCNISNDTITHA